MKGACLRAIRLGTSHWERILDRWFNSKTQYLLHLLLIWARNRLDAEHEHASDPHVVRIRYTCSCAFLSK